MTLSVVGVTGDVRHVGLAVPPRAEIFLDSLQSPLTWPPLVLVVRAHGDAASLADTVTAAVRDANPNVPITRVSTMDEIVARSIVEPRVYAFLLGLFAPLAAGLYGLVAYTVSQQTHELGIRLALGAARGQITRLVIGQGLGLALIGTGIGVAGAGGSDTDARQPDPLSAAERSGHLWRGRPRAAHDRARRHLPAGAPRVAR